MYFYGISLVTFGGPEDNHGWDNGDPERGECGQTDDLNLRYRFETIGSGSSVQAQMEDVSNGESNLHPRRPPANPLF